MTIVIAQLLCHLREINAPLIYTRRCTRLHSIGRKTQLAQLLRDAKTTWLRYSSSLNLCLSKVKQTI